MVLISVLMSQCTLGLEMILETKVVIPVPQSLSLEGATNEAFRFHVVMVVGNHVLSLATFFSLVVGY